MSTDKPLHVQVAEALGWSDSVLLGWYWWGLTPDELGHVEIPRYDTDWSATGPLIERHSINISRNSRLGSGPAWRAVWDDDSSFNVVADSPLEAVCRLILALKAAGKLDA